MSRFGRLLTVQAHMAVPGSHSMALNRGQGTTSLDSSKEQPLLSQHPHTTACKVEVCNRATNMDLANQKPLRIPNMNPIAAARIHIPRLVTLNPIWHATTTVREELSSCELRPAVDDIILVNRAREARIEREIVAVAGCAVRLDGACVGHVQFLVVRAEAEAVALREAVGDAPDLAGRGLEAVDLAGELGGEAEGLFVAVGWVWMSVSDLEGGRR